MSLRPNQVEYAEQTPTDAPRPAFNFTGDLFRPKLVNNNIPQIVGAITPENTVSNKPINPNRFKYDSFWPDDNYAQNPVDKLVNNEFKTNPQYKSDLIRDKPRQIDILPEEDAKLFKFSDHQEESPEATRPRNFNDFFNSKRK